MAVIENRSRFRVAVRNRDDLTRHFSHDQVAAVQACMAGLRERGFKPKAEQLDEHWLVRIRQVGYKPMELTFGSQATAETFAQTVACERKRGLFIDYAKAHTTTVAHLLVRFLREEAPKHKSRELLAYKIEGWLEDSGVKGIALLEAHRAQLRSMGLAVRQAKFKMRQSSTELDWIHRRLSEVTTVDIEEFITERLNTVAPATVDREIDILGSVFKVAIAVWDYNLVKNPMQAVRRPKYFNERDRRLLPGEEQRLLAALEQLDLQRAAEPILQELAQSALAGQAFTSISARKKSLAAVREALRPKAEELADVVPYLQTFFHFQVMTGARRSETHGLTWDRIDFAAGTAFLPETKNGRARKLSLRAELLSLLAQLPRNADQVFAVGLDYLVGAWGKACEMAGVEDLHIHDLRHEAISIVAETGQFTLPELQQFSGHRDIRMLMRYAHLCASRLAKKLDECFKDTHKVRVHRGRKMINERAGITTLQVLRACDAAIEQATAPQANSAPRTPQAHAQPACATSAKVYQFPGQGHRA